MTDEDWEAEAAQLRLRLTSVADEAVAIARQCFRDGEKAGRRYQLEQDKAWWKERFEAILADTELPRRWQLRKFWDAFVNLKIEGE